MKNVNLPEELADIRQQIDDLGLATLAYAGIGVTTEEYHIALIAGEDTIIVKKRFRSDDPENEIIQAIGKLASDNNIKIVSAAIVSNQRQEKLGERMWLEEDIVPLFSEEKEITEEVVRSAALSTCNTFDEHGLVNVATSQQQEVEVSWLVQKDSYKEQASEIEWQILEKLTDEFRSYETPLVFINATAQGGGVALMRHALLRFLNEIDVPSHWHVMRPNSDVFEITKRKFHNVLQAVARDGTVLTERDKDVYNAWIEENAEHLRDVFKHSNMIVIDDPQPCGLIPYIRDINPQAKIIYRSHIQLDRDLIENEGSPQHTTWSFLWEYIKQADIFVSHPVEQFVPRQVASNTVTMPATTDPFDGLNKPLSDTQMAYYRKLFNKILLEHIQGPLDDTRPYFVQIARFDPSKGIPDVIESYRLLREKLDSSDPIPQLVLAGHGSIDDPDGVPVYNMTLRLLQEERYRDIAQDVKVVRLHHNDQILNALIRASHGVLQLSHKEGFEVKVSEALHKGKPVVAYRAGGIPLQIEDGKSGFLVDIGDTSAVANHLYTLLKDENIYQEMSEYARRCVNPNHFTTYNAAKWLYLANTLLAGDKELGQGAAVQQLAGLPAAVC